MYLLAAGCCLLELSNGGRVQIEALHEGFRNVQTDLRTFLARYPGVVVITLVPVVFTAFVSTPFTLNRHPGEMTQVDAQARHMT